MSFWFLQFTQKTNENNSTWGTIVAKSIFFVELKIPKRHFEINWPLGGRQCQKCPKCLTVFRLIFQNLSKHVWHSWKKALFSVRSPWLCIYDSRLDLVITLKLSAYAIFTTFILTRNLQAWFYIYIVHTMYILLLLLMYRYCALKIKSANPFKSFNPIPTRWGRNQPSHCISRDHFG